MDGGKGHTETGEGEGLRLIPLLVLAAVHLDGAQANVVLCVEYDATTGSHRGAVGDDRGEETSGGHRRDGSALAVCHVFIVDVYVICQRVRHSGVSA